MNLPWDRFEGPLKWLVISVIVLLVASGLCGLQLAITNGGNHALDGLFFILGFVELGVMVIAALGVIASLIAWILWIIFPEKNNQ